MTIRASFRRSARRDREAAALATAFEVSAWPGLREPRVSRPLAWRLLDLAIAAVMWGIAIRLGVDVFATT